MATELPCQEPCQIVSWEPIGNLLPNLNGNWHLEFLEVALGTYERRTWKRT